MPAAFGLAWVAVATTFFFSLVAFFPPDFTLAMTFFFAVFTAFFTGLETRAIALPTAVFFVGALAFPRFTDPAFVLDLADFASDFNGFLTDFVLATVLLVKG
jgi:hypothetical protein